MESFLFFILNLFFKVFSNKNSTVHGQISCLFSSIEDFLKGRVWTLVRRGVARYLWVVIALMPCKTGRNPGVSGRAIPGISEVSSGSSRS